MDGDAPDAMRRDTLDVAEDSALAHPITRAIPHEPPPKRPRDETALLRALLLERGLAGLDHILRAEAAMRGTSLSLGQVLTFQGAISEAELLSMLSQIYDVGIADLASERPAPSLAAKLPADVAIASEVVVWKQAGSALVVATTRPDRVHVLHAHLPDVRRIVPVLAPRAQIIEAQRAVYGRERARVAEGRAPEKHSCRSWRGYALGRYILAATILGLIVLLLAPLALSEVVFGVAIVVLIGNSVLKLSAFAQCLRSEAHSPSPPQSAARLLHLPTVSILVPLFKEPEVAGALVERLRRIDYPRERLDIILAVEEDDPLTLKALRKGSLPTWMRAVIVPRGSPQTKPRALNYVLNYARGEIIGIYDAEDRPEPDQIHRVVQHFSTAPAKVACLQGRLDYYNARHNWLSRLFTVEYAAWFRVLLPGVQKMGLVVPLGGTTVFLRRTVLEAVGAWDAHNVTEDAELGLRLARSGYLTEIVETTTFEEANAAVLPWVKQRSRWLKGYLMTYGAAMRRPAVLLRDLGAWRFFWLQIQFVGAVLGFLSAPLLWSFMVKPFGIWHPLDAVLSPFAYGVLATIMLVGLFGSVAISIYACRAKHLRHLRAITPLVEPYYLFGTIAAWIGLFELMVKPFFWAKTTHGNFGASHPDTDDVGVLEEVTSSAAPLPAGGLGTRSIDAP
ncbi:glycosyltransferase [Gymnodinialimonas sp. 57CJ19]|uniref:glycosyltransferase family 2 protein n=1 Tax=Gymnodinialimonas sp. 57CJ19 TaxID=3138498 RepID=UPI00313442BA